MKDFSLYQKSRLVFKGLLLLLMILMVIPYMNALLLSYVRVFLVWGWLYILIDLVRGRKFWRNRLLLLLLAFCAAYGITILLNREAGLTRNAKDLLYMVMVFMLFFGRDESEEDGFVRAERDFLSRELLLLTFLLAAVCFGTFLFGVQYRYVVGDELCGVGVMGGRLWGLYNPNNGGALEAISILLSLGFLYEKKAGWWGIFCRLNLVLQALVLILGHSRTATYSLLAVLAVMLFVWLRRRARALPVCLVGAVLALGMGFVADEALFRGLMYLGQELHPTMVMAAENGEEKVISENDNDIAEFPKLADAVQTAAVETGNTWTITGTQRVTANKATEENEKTADTAGNAAAGTPGSGTAESETAVNESEAVDREALINEKFSYLEGREGGVLSGRPVLWKAGFQAFLEHPFLGVTREGLYDAVAVHVEDEAWLPDLGGGGVHSVYLTILVSSGLVGALIYGYVLILGGKRLLPALFRRGGKYLPHFGVDGWIVLLFLIVELAEARTMYQMRFFFVMFWMYSGYAVYEAGRIKEKGENV